MELSEIESALKTEYPEATEAEVKRFVRACQHGGKKISMEEVKVEAEKALEDYLDWRSCYGLDYKRDGTENETTIPNNGTDAADWKLAMEKAVVAWGSLKRAKEQEQKLAQAKDSTDDDQKAPVNYDVDLSDSQKSEKDDPTQDKEKSEVDDSSPNSDEETKTEEMLADEQKKKELSQVIFQHVLNDENIITDREGNKILYVLPALINRKVADADFYSLALSFYLDRKFDRASEEKMTVVIDVRAGAGWPNPMAVMMIKFAHTVAKQLQHRYPERLHSLVVFPLPFVAIGVWAAIKTVFQSEMMDKIMLVSGPAEQDSPVPMDKLEGRIDPEILDAIEKLRRDNFKPIGSF